MQVGEGSSGTCRACLIPFGSQEMLWWSPPGTDALPSPSRGRRWGRGEGFCVSRCLFQLEEAATPFQIA